MIFGDCDLDEAEGAILAHSVPLAKGRLRKGTRIGRAEIETLRAAGHAHVTVARLEAGDVEEDAAAARLARALVPEPEAAGLRIGRAATGRANLFAEAPGIVEIDAEAIHAVNRVDPMITVATVAPWQRTRERAMVATVKIIAYAVPEAALASACEAAAGAMRLRPVTIRSAELIQTEVSGASEDGRKGQEAIGARLERLGVALAPIRVVPHETGALAEAIARSEAEAIFVLTGSATSDIADVAPEALRRAGGEVALFGMPVDPGNLLFHGALGSKPVIGLPGCARSPALNGADWVMERLLCGVPVSRDDIARMGVGGLLKEIPLRGHPREG
ncbi:molybdopterin-binding protein [Litorisediminicola beolgyonensis]|uniref:Molybdopterin-binding protein n=1 Tax=Litorisediminicola beolgyonensis TaxID=1173614 RepID=A0ABW3ZNA2_9RHOB